MVTAVVKASWVRCALHVHSIVPWRAAVITFLYLSSILFLLLLFHLFFSHVLSDQCGDRSCNGNETCSTCAEDCGVCSKYKKTTKKKRRDKEERKNRKKMRNIITYMQLDSRVPCHDQSCSGHGTCVDGTCECIGTWNGPACESGI